MSELYREEKHTVWEPASYIREKFSLVDFLGSGFYRSVEGTIFLRKGTKEWQNYIDEKRKLFEFLNKEDSMASEKVQSSVDYLSREEFLLKPTNLWGLSYEKPGISRRILCDRDAEKIVCELSYPDKQIDVYRGSHGAMNTIGDQFQKIRERLYYSGTLKDALEEFRSQGFAFTIWDVLWTHRDINKVEPIKNAAIDNILTFANLNQA